MYNYDQPTAPNDLQQHVKAEVASNADSAFGKSLAAVILANFPICSIIAIIMGSLGLKAANTTRELADRYGISAGGKCTAAKIMGLIGMIYGIVNTAAYTLLIVFYFLYFILLLSMM